MNLLGNCLANVAALDACKGIFIGIANFALGYNVSLCLTDTQIHASGEKKHRRGRHVGVSEGGALGRRSGEGARG
jgi:hypothetical protein